MNERSGNADQQPTQGAATPDHAETAPDRRMLEMLVCPLTKAQLVWDRDRNELVSYGARLAFPIRKSIPLLYVGEARELTDEELEDRQKHKPVGID